LHLLSLIHSTIDSFVWHYRIPGDSFHNPPLSSNGEESPHPPTPIRSKGVNEDNYER